MPGRLRCLKPEAVNTVLFDFANKQAINELRCQGWTFVHAFLLMFARLGMDALPPKLLIQFAVERVEKVRFLRQALRSL